MITPSGRGSQATFSEEEEEEEEDVEAGAEDVESADDDSGFLSEPEGEVGETLELLLLELRLSVW